MNPARHPYRLTPARQLADTDVARHVADLVRLVLLTGAGERLHRPGFGAGLGASTLFEPMHDALLNVVEVRARGSLDEALGDRVHVESVTVRREGESTLHASVTYRLKPAGAQATVDVRTGA